MDFIVKNEILNKNIERERLSIFFYVFFCERLAAK
jgi:hypothetical protein